MKTFIHYDERDNAYIPIDDAILKLLGWSEGDLIHLDVPLTGGGLRIFKDSDPIVHMSGVKEVINGG